MTITEIMWANKGSLVYQSPSVQIVKELLHGCLPLQKSSFFPVYDGMANLV